MSKVVTAITSKILEPVSMSVSPDPDLGEISVGDDPTIVTITIENNSSDKIRKLNLLISKDQSLLKFRENNEGDVFSPGHGGTCSDVLQPEATCVFKLSFNPRKSGEFIIPVTLNYENLIEPQEKTITIKALTGEPASLVFVNDISTYDLGIIEQTEKITRFLELEIVNSGELSARSVVTSFLNINPTGAFELVSHNCPATIKSKQTCKVKIGYEPKNNEYTDPLVEYKSQLTLTYKRDSKGTQSNLNSYAEFISTTIEAKFKENFKVVDFGVLFTGNKLTKSVKITNVGFRAGIVQELILTDYQNQPITTCRKSATGNILDCNKTLDQFPFVIEDTNACFDNQTRGIEGKVQGASCIFTFTYWPSLKWQSGSQSTHYFNDIKVAIKYDSQWKGQENILVKSDVYNLFAEFLSAGKMEFVNMTVENVLVNPLNITTLGNETSIDLGRIALISSDAYSKIMKITWKNTGENVVLIDAISDKHNPLANTITEIGYNLNTFYKHIKSSASCGFVSPGATCNISYDLAPVLQASSALEDSLMYDDVSDLLKKKKIFTLHYNDGSKFEDNGDPSILRTYNTNLTAKLIKKGSLAFTSPLSSSTTLLNGQSTVKDVCLTNVGTGEVYAIKSDGAENLYPDGTNGWPFKIQDLSTITSSCANPATKDCFDIVYKNSDLLPMIPDPLKFLAVGETCVLSFEVKLADTVRDTSIELTYENDRIFVPLGSNTTSAWPRREAHINSAPVSFKYYDGDYISTDPASYMNYGYLGVTKKTSLSAHFYKPAQLVLSNPLPISSAVLHRPEIFYPLMSSTYPMNVTLTARTIPEMYFPGSFFSATSNGFTKSDEAYLHVNTLNLKGGVYDTEYKMHIGTFPVGESVTAALDVRNSGGSTAVGVTMTELGGVSPIVITAFGGLTIKPFPAFNITNTFFKQVLINFTPTAPGLFKKCFDLSFNNGLAPTEQHTCIYAEAVATAPKIKIDYSDIEVAMPGPVETFSGSYINLNAPLNGADATFTLFSGIKDSAIYAKKVFRFTNTGSVSARRFSYYYMASATNVQVPPGDTQLVSMPTKGCALNMTLLAGDYCEVYIKYKPSKTSSAALTRYLGVIYEVAPSSSQYVTQAAGIRFTALDPAKLSVLNTSPESLNDWSTPTAPLPISESWPLDLTAYNRTTTPHLVLDSMPQTRTFPIVTIKNTSALKASFLYMNPTPGPGVWNIIYTNSFVTVNASRGCFYGDDEFNAAIPANQKGFNSTSVNICQFSVLFFGHETYASCSVWSAPVKTKTVRIGELIDTSCNPYVFKLTYYNNNRSSYESLVFHAKGYIEPNRSTSMPNTPAFTNVTANFVSGSIGRATFSWPELMPLNASWGNIIKYRIYYDTSLLVLNGVNVFKLTGGPAFIETSNTSIRTATINNLVVGKYYYFKVMAVRTYAGLTYLSDTNMPLLTLPIPGADHIYHHETRTLTDKTYLPTPGNRVNGVTTCGLKYFNVSINGTVIKTYKKLVTTPVWNHLITNPAFNTGYPAEGVGSLPHWFGDAAYNLNTQISLYDGSTLLGYPDYLPASMSGNNTDLKVIYQKTCNNNETCDYLYKIAGGDDVDLYYQGVFYAKDTAATAFYRCTAVIKCPTNISKFITDGTCALP